MFLFKSSIRTIYSLFKEKYFPTFTIFEIGMYLIKKVKRNC